MAMMFGAFWPADPVVMSYLLANRKFNVLYNCVHVPRWKIRGAISPKRRSGTNHVFCLLFCAC